MKLGVISDTHGFFDPKIPKLLDGVEHIIHAGDVGGAFITFELEQIAPVTAVLGNVDSLMALRETEIVELSGMKFLVHHIVDPRALSEPLKSRITCARPDMVIFGHTHKPFQETIGGVLYLNPGYAGKSRFGMERSIAILECNEKGIKPKFLKLD